MRSKFKWIFTLLVAFTMQFSFAQQKTVTGTVTDDLGPVVGANVLVKGTKVGTATDFDGKFAISAKEGEILVVSYAGATEEVIVGAGSTYNVTLKALQLRIVEVVGALGIKRTKDQVTSAQKQINADELTQAVNPNAVLALNGKVSGLQISTTSNGVNPDTRIVLRGNRSISGDNQALIVIDNAISSANVLQQLPPDLIENINVIKGAQGAALYGAQGVNGAIIVTTKKGSKEEKFKVGVTSSIDFESVNFVPQYQQDYGQGWADDPGFDDPANPGVLSTFVPWENGTWGLPYNDPTTPAVLPVGLPQADGNFLFSDYAPIKDHLKKFFQTGLIMQNGFNLSSGGKDSYVFLAVNRQKNEFVVNGDELTRNSFIFKGGKKVGKFTLDGNINYITQKTSQTDGGLFEDLLQTPTNVPIRRFKNSGHEGHWTAYSKNPYKLSETDRFDNRSNVVNGIAAINYEFSKNFNVNYTANVQVTNRDAQSHRDAFTNVGQVADFGGYEYYGDTSATLEALGVSPLTSSFFASQTNIRNFYGDLLFNFNFDLNKDLNLKFNIGNNIQDNMFRVTSQGGTNLDVPGYYNIANVLNPAQPSSLNNDLIRSRRVAGFVNADLNYKDYLFLNVTGRVEQTSVVKDSYFYPSVGVSFVPTKAFESLKNNVFNYAKFSASYTSVGNTSAVAPYATNDVGVFAPGFPFGDLAGYQFNRRPTDPLIKPEFVNTLEFGAQFGFFNDRITIEGSYYIADTNDLITFKTASTPSGLRQVQSNIGDLQNKGFEIDLGLTPIKTESFKWNLNASYATYKTKILSLAEGVNEVNLLSNAEVGIFAEVGQEFPLIKGTKFVRDPDGNIVVNADGTHKKTSTFEKLGKGVPDFIVGLTNSFDYKGIKLTVVADYRYGASVYSEARRLMLFTGGALDTSGFDRSLGYVVPNSVQETSPGVYVTNTTPAGAASYSGTLNYFTGNYRNTGEANVIDAAALKIREISLSYSLPKKLIEKTGLESFRIGINARNPFVFLADGSLLKAKNGLSNDGYVDPEASITGGNAQGYANVGQYPTTSTFGTSINLTF